MLSTIKNIGRLTELAMVLMRHGFGDLVDHLELPFRDGTGSRASGEKLATRYSQYARMRMAAEEMGPTFVKLGQLLSQRPDLLPKDLILELRKLQDQVSPEPFNEMKTQVERALGRPIEEVFSSFDEKCLATASLAQVHRATRADTGVMVAVKVRKPGIVRVVEADLELMTGVARLLDEKVESLKMYDLPGVVKEMAQSLRRELDFSLEARHMMTARSQQDPDERIVIPQPYLDLTRPQVLTMQLIAGQRLAEAPLEQRQKAKLARELAEAMLRQVLENGFFHADPHPGNVLVEMDQGQEPRLALLDWGLTGRLTQKMRYQLGDLLTALVEKDARRVLKALASMGVTGAGSLEDPVLEQDVDSLLEEYYARPLNEIDTAKLILEVMELLRNHHLRVPGQFALVDKALLEMEGLSRLLDPDFNPMEIAKPFVRRLVMERWRPDVIVKSLFSHLAEGLKFVENLPRRLQDLLGQLEKGELGMELKVKGLDPLTRAVQEGASRVTVGLILAAMIVGSSMIITTGVEPKLFGLPALGVVGYVISGVLGLWLIWSILRSRGGRF